MLALRTRRDAIVENMVFFFGLRLRVLMDGWMDG